MRNIKTANGFTELTETEMYDVTGGWDWCKFGIGIAVGLAAGAAIFTGIGAVAVFAAGGTIATIATPLIIGGTIGAVAGGATAASKK